MKDIKAFLKIERKDSKYRPVKERIKDYKEVSLQRSDEQSKEQASRCMDCGTPFCQWACPIGNYIPEWNDAVLAGHWEKAFRLLNASNNLPEITGRVCPALCEFSCVLGINDEAVTIRENGLSIIEYAFKNGLVKPNPPKLRSGKKVAVIGSGPAGLATAVWLNMAGHKVTVFERDERIGGIIRYGIPDFKLEKSLIDRRVDLWKEEGIEFKTKANVGKDIKAGELLKKFDALCLTIGSRMARDLKIEGKELNGIHFAMDYLIQSNKRVSGQKFSSEELIDAKDKKVVIIGGGDTGSDCVGTANRQGAGFIVQIEVLPKPSEVRSEEFPWPVYPVLLKTTSSHEEGCQRRWSVLTKKFIGAKGRVKKLSCVEVEFVRTGDSSPPVMKELSGTEFEIEADLVILAVGFLHPEHTGLVAELGLELDSRGNLRSGRNFMTSKRGVFCAGDARCGQSLIVRAISEGREAARYIDTYLKDTKKMGEG